MKPCPSRERLGQFLGHQLTGVHRTTIIEHVEECSACQAVLKELTRDPSFDRPQLRSDVSSSADLPRTDFLRRLKETKVGE